MKKHYYLYLDESGDFDEDLHRFYRNQCLVGGFLLADSPIIEASAETLIGNSWSSVVPDDLRLPLAKKINRAKHATELVTGGTIQQHQVAELHRKIIQEVAKLGKLVVFENYQKTRIEDSTRTYLYVMTDGITQLFQRLVATHANDDVILHVLAGYRKDMTMKEENRTDISCAEYTSRLRELL